MQFIPQSIKNLYHFVNALAAVMYYRYPAQKLTVIGVTGTDGKTTTSTMIYEILKAAGQKVALISTVAAYIGDEAIDTGFHVTSPNPWALQKLFQQIYHRDFTHVVLEVTSHGLDQSRVLGANIRYGVLTNVTPEHLDYHHTYANYLNTKSKLFAHAQIAVLNADDRSFASLQALVSPRCKIIPYSLNTPSLLLAVAQKRFTEPYNQSNAMAALTLTQALNISVDACQRGLQQFAGVCGRMERIPNAKNLQIIVDFAHTPNALENALTVIRKETKGRLIAVYGAAGLRDAFKRPLMGEIGARLADEVIFTAEDPRTEDVHTIIREMKEGVKQNHGHVHAIADRRQAIDFAINHLAHTEDTVAVLGKGHERAMNLDGKHEIPWSDQDIVRDCLK